jgi:hypothetical protein
MARGEADRHPDQPDAGQVTVTTAGWIAAGLVFYVLSVGPAILVYDGLPKPAQKAVELVYAPVVWLAESPVGEPLQWYALLWLR